MRKSHVYALLAVLGVMAVLGMLAGYQATLFLKESFTEKAPDELRDPKKDRVQETFRLLLEREPTAAEVEKYADGALASVEARIMEDYAPAS
jgi:hypothetical protein